MTKKADAAIFDNPSPFAANLKAYLSNRGFESRSFAHYEELLGWARQYDAPGVVLFDAVPEVKRFDPLKALKATYPEAESIVMSADGHHSMVSEGESPVSYVSKPVTPETRCESRLDPGTDRAIKRTLVGRTQSRVDFSDSRASGDDDGCIWGTGEQMRVIARTIDQIADSDVTVLLRGESGVGKGLVARALHDRSARRSSAFVKVNCAALPADLLESELFGHERGAFTGAVSTRIGKFEQADGGTLLLDEIGEMKPALQPKLLHVLQDGEFDKLGSNKHIRTNVRVVAATNCNLEQMRVGGSFREDLYYRLGVIELTVPPLRERRDDIPKLLDWFLARCSRQYGRSIRPLSAHIRALFEDYDWPGNVRELENMITRIVVLQDEQLVTREIEQKLGQRVPHAPVGGTATAAAGMSLASARLAAAGARGARSSSHTELPVEPSDADPVEGDESSLVAVAKAAAMRAEHGAILEMLSKVHWNRRKAAQALGVSYKTLLNKMKLCGITQG
jgi:DNA-binding NtrC family response regulator